MGEVISHPTRYQEEGALLDDVTTLVESYAGKVSVGQVVGVLEIAKMAVMEQQTATWATEGDDE